LALYHVPSDPERGAIFNFGTRDGASAREVVTAAERVLEAKVPVVYAEHRPRDQATRVADSSRARRELGWHPTRSTLEEMIASAWEWKCRFHEGYPDGE
jgi:UDP-glucose 4-epimerase